MRDFIKEGVERGETLEEIKLRRQELSDTLNCTIKQVAAATAWKKQDDGSLVLEELLPNDPTKIDEPDLRNGSHMDYSFESKNKWRDKWREFLMNNTEPEKRGSMRVLCLPGKKCLEIPLYLDLGFKPENIVGVEGGDLAARMEFLENAAKYQINASVGRLEELLKTEHKRFDVISLDFEGQLCFNHVKVFYFLPIADEAVILLNQQAKRENSLSQDILLRRYCINLDIASIEPDTLENAKENYKTIQETEPHILREARHTSLAGVFLNFAGTFSQGRSPLFLRYCEELKFSASIIEQSNYDVRYALQKFLSKQCSEEGAQGTAFIAQFLCETGLENSALAEGLEQYEYQSPNHTPMYSSFLKVKVPRKECESTRRTIEFIHKCKLAKMQSLNSGKNEQLEFSVRDKSMGSIKPKTQFRSDNLVCSLGRHFITNIKLGKFLDDIGIAITLNNERVWITDFEKRTKI